MRLKTTLSSLSLCLTALSIAQSDVMAPKLSWNVVTDLGFNRAAIVGAFRLTPLTSFFGRNSLNKLSPVLYGIGGVEGKLGSSTLPTGGFALGFTVPIAKEFALTLGPQFRFQSGNKPQFGMMIGFAIQ